MNLTATPLIRPNLPGLVFTFEVSDMHDNPSLLLVDGFSVQILDLHEQDWVDS